MRFSGSARMDAEGHIIESDEAVAYLTPDDEKVTRMELRGSSRIAGKPGQSGPKLMSARDIDMAYAPDGRTLQSAHLIEGAAVELPGDPGKPGRRIAGKTIDIAMAPDGATVTNLVANENVQVDLPADGDTPARRIRSASLLATGAPGSRHPGRDVFGQRGLQGDPPGAEGRWRPSIAPPGPSAWTSTQSPGSAISRAPTFTTTCTLRTGPTQPPTHRPRSIPRPGSLDGHGAWLG